MALKLQQKGFVVMEKDPHDGRITRIKLTDAVAAFSKKKPGKISNLHRKIVAGLTAEEMAVTRSALAKLLTNLEKMDRDQNKRRKNG